MLRCVALCMHRHTQSKYEGISIKYIILTIFQSLEMEWEKRINRWKINEKRIESYRVDFSTHHLNFLQNHGSVQYIIMYILYAISILYKIVREWNGISMSSMYLYIYILITVENNQIVFVERWWTETWSLHYCVCKQNNFTIQIAYWHRENM